MNPDALYFTSDPHFGHGLLVRNGMRPFASTEEMDEALIANWNRTVPRNSDVFVLGDVSFRRDLETSLLLHRLYGRLHLIKGNHDRGMGARVKACFDSIDHYRVLRVEQTKIVLFHFPIVSWYAAHYGSWHLHGHSHGSCPPLGRRYDVGVDCNNLRPVSFRELAPILNARAIETGDGHKPKLEAANDPVFAQAEGKVA